MSQVRLFEPISEAEYKAIESAITETARGRWFLAEFARRSRTADNQVLLGAICRLEEALERACSPTREPRVSRLRRTPPQA
jgi:hypothetical protein